MNISDIRTLQILKAVESEKSYAGAARLLGLTRAAVSRNIADAEQRLDLRLTRRTTRQVELSPAARELLTRVAQPLEDIETAIASLEEGDHNLKGSINISVSHALGRRLLMPRLREFAQAYPSVRYSISLTESLENLVSSPADIAVRMGTTHTDNIIARRLPSLALGIYAGAAFKPNMTIEEAKDAPKIAFRVPGADQVFHWTLKSPEGEIFNLELNSEPYEVDSIEAVLDLTCASAGISALPQYLAQPAMQRREINQVLKRYSLDPIDCYLCYYHREHIPQRIRALIDFLVEKF